MDNISSSQLLFSDSQLDQPGSQSTQPTQRENDPRRLEPEKSPVSDEDISDIICILHPSSDSALREVTGLVERGSPFVVSSSDIALGKSRFEDNFIDDASRFQITQPMSKYSIVLRLSDNVKDPHLGFVFGRNAGRCDICFVNDPLRRLSNSHFRIYVNEYGIIMLEDRSTNGTIVDTDVLRSKDSDPQHVRRTLTTGGRIKILMHNQSEDIVFAVRIPKREGTHAAEWSEKVAEFFRKHMLPPLIAPIPQPNATRDIFHGHQGRTPRPQLPTLPPANGAIGAQPWDGAGKYNRIDYIGKGAFAVVYRVTDKYNGTPYAAKELDKRRFLKNGVIDQRVDNEMRIMRQVRHPNIVQYIDHFDWQDRLLIIIMELVQGGDLGKYVNENGPIPEVIVQEISRQMISALDYLHKKNITHRDVKPDNILISSTNPFVVKLTDFGLSKVVDNEQTFLRTFCGTLLYCAPEVYAEFAEYDENGVRDPSNRNKNRKPGQRYGHAIDIWSLGGVIFFILTGRPPYPVQNGDTSYTQLLNHIMTRKLDVGPLKRALVSKEGISFLQSMLRCRPDERATIQDLVNHPWLQSTSVGSSQASLDEASDTEIDDDASITEVMPLGKNQVIPYNNFSINGDDVEMTDSFMDEIANQFYNEAYTTVQGNNIYQTDTSLQVQQQLHQQQHQYEKQQQQQQQKQQKQQQNFRETISNSSESGVLPALPVPNSCTDSEYDTNFGSTRIIGDSDNSNLPASKPVHHYLPASGHLQVPIGESGILGGQSNDQVLSLVEGVASQSLCSEYNNELTTNQNEHVVSSSIELTSAKRKTDFDSSGDYSETSAGVYAIKRARSDLQTTRIPVISAEEKAELSLLARIPSINRLESGRHIDMPVHKSRFWEKNVSSYHLKYPEMTQLQITAFKQAAADRGETFEPGKTPLWNLAMKHFPPTDWKAIAETGSSALMAPRDIPATTQNYVTQSSIYSHESIPSQTPTVTDDAMVLMSLVSAPDSRVQNINVQCTDSVLTWGRSPVNLVQHQVVSETRIPKTAVRILLWAPEYDASRDKPNNLPWLPNQPRPVDQFKYFFYVSTKSTRGIHVNNVLLPSHNYNDFDSPSRNWIRLYTGDELTLWGKDSNCTKIIFTCHWGGSRAKRPENSDLLLETAEVARKLDEISLRAERKRFETRYYEAREEEAMYDYNQRVKHVELERERSVRFEELRRRAVDYMAAQAMMADTQGKENFTMAREKPRVKTM
ncbi:hypothetical protein TD95_004535 [Thielaviopsis punctulata]|uniref:Autophagy-related protein 1 n=1 Tax=Thielaviopsis punctulata TaxID=72032 RepID=A0A0F4ZFL6_9PEZI|nr:hypothetical protein TD95_004535 [Thielaviopsis punctulata]